MTSPVFTCRSVESLGTMSSGKVTWEILLERWNAETLSTETIRFVRLRPFIFEPGKLYLFGCREWSEVDEQRRANLDKLVDG